MSDLIAREYKCFEDIKQIRKDGSEYWYARDLADVLDYSKWENFAKVIKRAMIACENSGRSVSDDFPEVRKIVEAGATSKGIVDYELSRYACYLASSRWAWVVNRSSSGVNKSATLGFAKFRHLLHKTKIRFGCFAAGLMAEDALVYLL